MIDSKFETNLGVAFAPGVTTIPGTSPGQARALVDWPTAPFVMDFVMWKPIVATNGESGPDSVASPWKVLFRDE